MLYRNFDNDRLIKVDLIVKTVKRLYIQTCLKYILNISKVEIYNMLSKLIRIKYVVDKFSYRNFR